MNDIMTKINSMSDREIVAAIFIDNHNASPNGGMFVPKGGAKVLLK